MKKSLLLKLGVFVLAASSLMACKKYRKYDNMEVVEDSFTGNVIIESVGSDPGGDFEGSGDSGVFSFVWDNSSDKAELNYDITSNTGSVQFIINDAKGNEVLNKTRNAGGDDTFSGNTDSGKKGKWLVQITLTDFNGDGSFSLSPVE